ncbi:MAG TPA: spermidine/putrescine ABC transporter substrate-binding protein [Symbiobacteriaceae bacterium]|nr:spermidine/putrescine ABC transporter substrate-binding protein [Symbiobacteriaceae bacterium]
MWKRPLVALLLVAAVGAMAGCSTKTETPPASNSNGGNVPAPSTQTDGVDKSKLGKELNLFSWAEYFPEEVLKGFETEYGVKINYDTYANNEEMASKLQAGGGQYDLAVPSTYMVESLAKQGLLQEIDQKLLPNMKNLDPQFLNLPHDKGNKFSVPYMWGTMSVAYNSKYVTKAPEKWADLLDPAYKNKIVAVDDGREIFGIGLQALGYSRNETDPKKLKEAQEWLKKLMPNIKAWDSDNPKAMLISEEAWIGLVWNGEAALAMAENKDIKYMIPKDGGSIWLDNMVVPKGAKNAYTAHVFMNYIMRPEVAAKVGTGYPYGLPNLKGFELLPAEIKSNVASYPPKAWLAKVEYAADLGEKAADVDQAYTELKAGQ